MNRVLLAEPSFPVPAKSKNHKDFLPIGLLKIASFFRANGSEVKLVRGFPDGDFAQRKEIIDFGPANIYVTSLFTYWSKQVKDTVEYYRSLFPKARIVVGGIYASLMPDHCKEYTGCDEVHIGVFREAEACIPAYDLLESANGHPLDYQIIHASRGCVRKCPFCGVWKLDPEFKPKESIKDEITARKVVFYDNNFLFNPNAEKILEELAALRKAKKLDWAESQSGFDGRVMLAKPHLVKMIRDAGFRDPRIAWDWGYDHAESIRQQVDLLLEAGYKSKDIYIFMIHNWDIPFDEMEMKRIKCWEWKIQIADCRYRPLDQTYDRYNPLRRQTGDEYHIHSGWTDETVKQFRANVRRQNICVRHGFRFYSHRLERKRFSTCDNPSFATGPKSIPEDAWFPDKITSPVGTAFAHST